MQVEMWGRPMLVLSSCLQPQDRGHTTAGLCRAIKEQHSHSLAWRGLCARLILSGCKTHPASLHSFPASIWVLHRPQLPSWHIHPLWNGVLHSLSDGYILEHQLSTGYRDISAWVPGALPAPLLLSPGCLQGHFSRFPSVFLPVFSCVVFVLPFPGCSWGTTILVPCRGGLRASWNMVQPWPPLIQ